VHDYLWTIALLALSCTRSCLMGSRRIEEVDGGDNWQTDVWAN
jgi:hypothetical protein